MENVSKTQTVKRYAVIVGFGNRGQIYADYSIDGKDELGIVAVVDPNEFKLKTAGKRYGLNDGSLFKTFAEFAKSGIKCDIVINATMDDLHYSTGKEILSYGYDMLIEKPIVSNTEQLMGLKKLAEEKSCSVYVCHVLRYTPFYLKIKKLINSGVIGKIMSMEINEHVGIGHYLTSYVRGKWNSEATGGSGFLLAKSCHDMDIMCWLNNSTEPYSVSSFGARAQFIKEMAPEGATEYCLDCPHERTCQYSAVRYYMEQNVLPFLTWDKLNKPLDRITEEEKIKHLKTDNYGRCAYDAGGDIVDRQSITVGFKNGSTCSFTLVGGATLAGRHIHVVGTKGEIQGRLEDNKFVLRTLNEQCLCQEEVISVEEEIVNNVAFGGHSGGDFAIIKDLLGYINGDRTSLSITSLDDSINGHLCVYMAEKARKEGKVVYIDELK